MAFTAKDVQALRQATGAGMMDAKKALEANDGDMEAAKQWLREKGLRPAPSATTARTPRASSPWSSTATSARSSSSSARPTSSPAATSSRPRPSAGQPRRRQGRRRRRRAGAGARRPQDHAQGEHRAGRRRAHRGRRRQRARQLPAHPGRPRRQRRARRDGRRHATSWPTTSPCTSPSPGRSTSAATTCRPTSSTHERQTLETISRNEGKPEQALPKIVEGRLGGFFKDVALLDQPYAKDDKQSISQLLGGATIVRFAQVEIG